MTHFRYRTKLVTDLTAEEANLCRANTLHGEGGWGAMQPQFNKLRDFGGDGWATILWGENKEFLGWALTFVADGYGVGKRGERASYFYVPRKLRRKGYGRQLHRAVLRRFGDVAVQPWNDSSEKFFASVGASGRFAWA